MSAVLSALPELPELVQPAQTINGKRIRVPPRVNLGDITVNNLGTVRKLHNVLFPVSYLPGFYSALVDDRAHHPEDYCKLVFYQDLPVGVLVCRLEEADRVAPKTLSEAVAKEQQAAKTADDGADGKKEVDDQKTYKLYVMTLGVLAPYRHQGLGSKLIHQVLATAAASLAQPAPSPSPSSAATVNGSSKPSGAKSAKKSDENGQAAEQQKKREKDEEEREPLKPRVESVYLHVQVENDEAKQFWEKWGFEVKETVPDYYRKISPRDAWLLERKVAPAATPAPSSA
ncbi:hypothetical protein JCM8202_002652 [Rhodotorula sphaerocarpa]